MVPERPWPVWGSTKRPPEPRSHNQPASTGVRVRQPHPETLHPVRQRSRERVTGVDKLQRGNLTVRQACIRAGIRWIWIHIARTALGRPWFAAGLALFHIEDRTAGHVVVHDAVRQAIQLVALTHYFAAYRVDFGERDPVGRRLFLNPDEFRS